MFNAVYRGGSDFAGANQTTMETVGYKGVSSSG